jgi:hypothetical protein
MRPQVRWISIALIATVAGAVITTPASSSTPPPQLWRASDAVSAVAALGRLAVKGRAAKTGYTRSQFGPAWKDVDRNGCDTRSDVLRRDLRSVTLSANGCTILSGVLTDPYSGVVLAYPGGNFQVDHLVPLADAWVTGAQRLTLTRRTALANDPLNLLATTATMNDRKGSGDAATWLPPRTSFRCTYVARQIAVKRIYALWITAAEKAAMARILATCPGQQLPTSASTATPRRVQRPSSTTTSATTSTSTTSTPTSATPTFTTTSTSATTSTSTTTVTSTSTTTSTTTGATDPRFATCKAAKAAGYGPYYRGVDPEYSWYRDADSDGIVCE